MEQEYLMQTPFEPFQRTSLIDLLATFQKSDIISEWWQQRDINISNLHSCLRGFLGRQSQKTDGCSRQYMGCPSSSEKEWMAALQQDVFLLQLMGCC